MAYGESTYTTLGGGSVKRAAPVLPTMTLGDVVMRIHPEYPQLEARFECRPLSAELTPTACKANFLNRHCKSCHDCPVGAFNAGVPLRTRLELINDHNLDRHVRALAVQGLSCIRCGRDEASATRFVGRFRIVGRQHCVSCFNRQSEFVKQCNSKGAPPRLKLFESAVTIEAEDGTRSTLGIGLRLDHLECHRYVERFHPGATLVETSIADEIIPQFSLWTPLPFSPWEPTAPKKAAKSRPIVSMQAAAQSPSFDPDLDDPEYRPDWFKKAKAERALPAEKRVGKWNDDRNIVWNRMPVADDTEAAEDPDEWTDPNYRPQWHHAKSSGISAADGSGTARRSGWLQPLTEYDEAAYRRSFDDDDCEPTYRKALAAIDAAPVAADESIPLQSEDDELILDAWPALEVDPELGLAPFMAWLADGLPEPHPVDAKPIAAPEAPREPYLVLTSGAIIGDAADLAAFKAGKEFPSGSKPVAYGEPAEPFADVPANVASPDAGRTKAARVPGTRAIDITGHRYNLLTAVAYEGADDCGFAIWRFHCDCGNEKSIRSYRVRTGAYVSCGCFEKSAVRQRRKQDGQLTEQEIAEWREIVGEKREPTEPLTNIPAIVAPPEVVEPVVSAPNAPCMHTLDLGTLPTNKPAKRTEPKLSKAQRKAEKRAHRNERQAERAMQAARDAGRPVFALKQVAVASKAVVLLAGYGMHRRRIV